MLTPTLKLMLEHRSIRSFTDEQIAQNDVDNIMLAAQAASTSSFQQAVSIIQVDDAAKREELMRISNGQSHIASAARYFVFCADYHRHQHIVAEAKLGFTEQLISGAVDAALMGQNALLAAESMGLGGLFIGAMRNDPDAVCDLLQLPQHVFPLFGLCLGHPADKPEVKPRLPLSMVLHKENYHALDTKSLSAYNNVVENYYQKRSSNNKKSDWSQMMKTRFSKESRPFMLTSLNKQGFVKF